MPAIRQLFFSPPLAFARLGGSSTPLDAFEWVPADPHVIAETAVRPTWSLDVLGDGSVAPRLPRELVLRDGEELRPVAPFLELWALLDDGTHAPVTDALLAAQGVDRGALTFEVVAMNFKAARRTGNAAVRFGTFPPVVVRGDQHARVELAGVSPPGLVTPMIPAGRRIALGTIQVLRPTPRPAGAPWPAELLTDVVRLRFTPARGRFFGPPEAAAGALPAVPAAQAFLDRAGGWFGTTPREVVEPGDTFDGFGQGGAQSLGVVDDTCDARITATLALVQPLRCHANVASGPPHFAPDRRPFLSIADEINDRQHDRQRDAALTSAERSAWVEDLFERVFETLSLMNVDRWRGALGIERLPPDQRQAAIAGDGLPEPERAMGARDRLRDPNIRVLPPSPNAPLPLSQRARERHRMLSDVRTLEPWVRANPGRIAALVRPPFRVEAWEERFAQSMQMPPFMNNSNAGPLSLAQWQYDLLMAWVAAVTDPNAPTLLAVEPSGEPALSDAAARRRAAVLATLGEDEP